MDVDERIGLIFKAANVFRPGTPINQYALFAGRTEQVNDIISAISQPGRHAIMFGERGVGKTSLAKVLCQILKKSGIDLLGSDTINCDGTDNFSSLWHKIFRELSFSITNQEMGFRDKEESKEVSLDALLPEQVTPDDIRYAFGRVNKQNVVIFVDELDRIKDELATTLLADTIKNLSDHSANVTLVLIGVADSVDQLIAEHLSIERALVQVPMPRMSLGELTEIIDRGMTEIGMTMDEDAKIFIVHLSQGLPHYTHSLALYATQEAIGKDSKHIEMEDVNRAIHLVVNKSETILAAYHRATSSPQKQSQYAQVLLACALADKDALGYFTAADVRSPMSAIMKKPYDIPAFSRHLDDFCTGKRGPVLNRTGISRHYRFRFVNPLMQPFVVLHGLANGLISEQTVTEHS